MDVITYPYHNHNDGLLSKDRVSGSQYWGDWRGVLSFSQFSTRRFHLLTFLSMRGYQDSSLTNRRKVTHPILLTRRFTDDGFRMTSGNVPLDYVIMAGVSVAFIIGFLVPIITIVCYYKKKAAGKLKVKPSHFFCCNRLCWKRKIVSVAYEYETEQCWVSSSHRSKWQRYRSTLVTRKITYRIVFINRAFVFFF